MTNHNFRSPDESYEAARKFAASIRFAEAIEAYTAAIDGDSKHVKAWCGRGLAFQRIAEHVAAIADFDHVIHSFPTWAGTCMVFYERARSRRALGQNAAAVGDCNEALRRKPDLIDAIYLRGIAAKSLEQFDDAMSDMDVVLHVDPSYSEAYHVRGTLHNFQGNWRLALEDFTAALNHGIARTEYASVCYFFRGRAAQELGQHTFAVADFTTALEFDPNNASVYVRRWQSYRELGDSAAAEADLQKANRLLSVQEASRRVP
jgi:tetratricopeptide (TPR) repeat protein